MSRVKGSHMRRNVGGWVTLVGFAVVPIAGCGSNNTTNDGFANQGGTATASTAGAGGSAGSVTNTITGGRGTGGRPSTGGAKATGGLSAIPCPAGNQGCSCLDTTPRCNAGLTCQPPYNQCCNATSCAIPTGTGGKAGTGGSRSNGGSTAVAGNTSAGGTQAGGVTSTSAGDTSVGGDTSNGGAASDGGASSIGGSSPIGGDTSNGGATANGGASQVGGTSANGGATSTGPALTGGVTATGGVSAAAGKSATGGTSSVASATGGTTTAGGVSGTGGSSGVLTCPTAVFTQPTTACGTGQYPVGTTCSRSVSASSGGTVTFDCSCVQGTSGTNWNCTAGSSTIAACPVTVVDNTGVVACTTVASTCYVQVDIGAGFLAKYNCSCSASNTWSCVTS